MKYTLLHCYRASAFSEGNQAIAETEARTESEAIVAFRQSYPELPDNGYLKLKDGTSLIVAEHHTAL